MKTRRTYGKQYSVATYNYVEPKGSTMSFAHDTRTSKEASQEVEEASLVDYVNKLTSLELVTLCILSP